MIRDNQRFFNRANLLLTGVIASVSLLLGHWFRYHVLFSEYQPGPFSEILWLAAVSALLHMLLYPAVGLYESQRRRKIRNALMRIFAAEGISTLVILSLLYMLNLSDISRLALLVSGVFSTLLSCIKYIATHAILRKMRKKGRNQKHVVLIGGTKGAHSYRRVLEAHPEYGYTIVGYFAPEADWPSQRWLGTYADIESCFDTLVPDEAVIAISAEDYVHIVDIIRVCERTGTFLRIIPCYDQYISSRMRVETLDGINIEDIRSVPLSMPGNALVKRMVDIIVSLLAIIITSPLMVISVVGIRLTSPGPILFRQERMGKDKKLFQMLKFRSMHLNDSHDTAWTENEDSRKTRFGAVLRKLSIDELPQFFNVLRGEMSVVGPRPELPYHVERLRDEVPLYMIKHYVKPGITGWAQVNGFRGDTSIPLRIEHDIYYIENWSLWFDIKIMIMTVFKMVNSEQVI